MQWTKTTCNIMFFRFLAETGPPGSKNGYFGGKLGTQKNHFFSKTYPQNFIILHQKTPFGSTIIMRNKIGAALHQKNFSMAIWT